MASKSADTEFEITHNGITYIVGINYDTIKVDDSFDGHLGGYVHTFESSHTAIDEDSIEIVYCEAEEGEIDEEEVDGLVEHIIETAKEIEL
jgi:hypothetical protein